MSWKVDEDGHRVGEATWEGLQKAYLDQAEVAWVLGTSARTVSRWLQKEASPRPEARERILELLAVLGQLSVTLRPEPAHDWLSTPNPLLSRHKPAARLRESPYQEVLGAVDALAEGVFV